MTIEHLKAKRAALEADQKKVVEQANAQINAMAGAMQTLDGLIAEMEAQQSPSSPLMAAIAGTSHDSKKKAKP